MGDYYELDKKRNEGTGEAAAATAVLDVLFGLPAAGINHGQYFY